VTAAPTSTEDRLLGGRVALAQPEHGYRAAIDPVLLAAAISAGTGETVLDAGCGTGAAALCLAARLQNCAVTGVELDPELAALARANVRSNGMEDRVAVAEGSFATFARAHRAEFDQVMMNPPFNEDGKHTASPAATRAVAHIEGTLDLTGWIEAAALALKPAGRLTVIHRADRLASILTAFEGRFGAALVYPLWPRAGVEAKRILVGAVKGRRTLPRILPGMALHRADGAYTDRARAILREAAPLDLLAPSA
jgi:tRNA1(Val) A37 N6-methylase TrmN6